MKKIDWLYGQNWVAQIQDAYTNGILCSTVTPRSIERCLIERHERPSTLIMHINWRRSGVIMSNVWQLRYTITESNGYINILIR